MSVLKDVKSKLSLNPSLLPANRSADTNGSGVDTQDSIGVMLMATIGAPGDTLSSSVKIEMEAQHSDDNSTFVACADSDLSAAAVGSNTGTIVSVQANAAASQIYKVNYLGSKRYVRVVDNRTGTHTNGTPTSATVVLLPVHAPAL